MSTETSLTSVIELKPDGSNWMSWKFNIESVTAYKDWSIHLTDKAVEPTAPGPYAPPTATATATTATLDYEKHRDQVAKYEKEKENFRQGNRVSTA
jgi:hypothetical protein